tara:strand:+ start:121 stop:336 length:216 start_codon:yes stop_codon:yes gene_type:complete
MANKTLDYWFKAPSKNTSKKTTKKKAVKKGPSVVKQFEKVEDSNDDLNLELKKLKRMIKTSKSSPRKYKRS